MSRYLSSRRFAFEAVLAQLCVVSVLSLAFSVIDKYMAGAFAIGGIIGTSATLVQAWLVFRAPLGSSAQKIVADAHLATLGKLFVTALLFLVAFARCEFLSDPRYAMVCISTFVGIQLVSWIYLQVRR